MRKRLLYIGVMAAIAVGCTTQGDFGSDDSLAQQNLGEQITIKVFSSQGDGVDSRVAVSDKEGGGLAVTWADTSETIGGWSSGASDFECFTMTYLSDDKESALFTGTSTNTTMRFVHPYDSNLAISGGKFNLDLSSQTIDISADAGLGSIGSSTYMISEPIDTENLSAISMQHIAAAFRIGLRFEGIDSSKDYSITKLILGNDDNGVMKMPMEASVDLNEDIDSDDFLVLTKEGSVTIDVVGSPVVSNYKDNAETYYVNFNVLPFCFEPQDVIMLGVELTPADGTSSSTSLVFSITYTGVDNFDIPRASYTYLNYYCTLELVAGATIQDWFGQQDEATDIRPETSNYIEIESLATLTAETMLADDVWNIIGDQESFDFSVADALLLEADRKVSLNFLDLTSMADGAFTSMNTVKAVSMPKVISFEGSAFSSCTSLQSVNLPNLETINGSAFYECTALDTVSLPKVTSISADIFYDCTALKAIDMPEIEVLPSYVARGCGNLTSVNMPKAKTFSGTHIFFNCLSLEVVSLPEAVSFGNFSFYNCPSLYDVSLPKAETFGYEPFLNSDKLVSISLPSAKKLGQYAFSRSKLLENVDLPLAEIFEQGAFWDCASLVTIELPSAKTFGRLAFQDSEKLTTIILPVVESFVSDAFSGCTGLRVLKLATDPTAYLSTIGTDPFKNVTTTDIDLTVGVLNAGYVQDDGMSFVISSQTLTFNGITVL